MFNVQRLFPPQLNCGWHGNDKHWAGKHKNYPYKGTPNNNLGKNIVFFDEAKYFVLGWWVFFTLNFWEMCNRGKTIFILSSSFLLTFPILSPSVREWRLDGSCGLNNRMTYPDTANWTYSDDQVLFIVHGHHFSVWT